MKSLSIKSFLFRSASLLALALLASCGGSPDVSLPLVFSATLSGAEETPPNASSGKGIGILTFNPNDRTFHARVVSVGVADNAAHIHQGAPGVAGPIVIPLTKAPGSLMWEAKGTLSQDQEATLRAGNIDYYFNVHSPSFPQGEIRGQLERRALSPEQQQRAEQLLQQLISQLQLQSQAAAPGTGAPATPTTPGTPVTPATPGAGTPATPATPAIPARPGAGTPATPAIPAIPATPSTGNRP